VKDRPRSIEEETVRKRTVSVLIPVFNNAESLHDLLNELIESLKVVCFQYRFEIVFIDDSSTDGSLEVLQELQILSAEKASFKIKIVAMAFNAGQGNAILAGLEVCTGDWFVNLDADGQDPPSVIPRMLESKESNRFSFVAAIRSGYEKNHKVKRLSIIAHFILSKVYKNYPRQGFSIFLGDSSVKRYLLSKTDEVRFLQTELVQKFSNFGVVEYQRRFRKHGESQTGYTSRGISFASALISSLVDSARRILFFTVALLVVILLMIVCLFFYFFATGSFFRGVTFFYMFVIVILSIQLFLIALIVELSSRSLRKPAKGYLYTYHVLGEDGNVVVDSSEKLGQ